MDCEDHIYFLDRRRSEAITFELDPIEREELLNALHKRGLVDLNSVLPKLLIEGEAKQILGFLKIKAFQGKSNPLNLVSPVFTEIEGNEAKSLSFFLIGEILLSFFLNGQNRLQLERLVFRAADQLVNIELSVAIEVRFFLELEAVRCNGHLHSDLTSIILLQSLLQGNHIPVP